MFRVLPYVMVFAGVVTAGVIPGLWSYRWQPSALDEAAARLSGVPSTVGEWDGRDQAVDPREHRMSQASGMLRRDYVNRRTGSAVSLLLVCGRAGPVSVHTPEVCYRNSGFDEVGAPTRCGIPGQDADSLWVRQFQKAGAAPVRLRIVYGWTAGGDWEAPDNARWAFAGRPLLYKLYAIREVGRTDEPLGDDALLEFLRALRRPLREALFPPA